MSALEFTWNLSQDGKIYSLEERIEILEKNLEIAHEWVKYLNGRVDELERRENILAGDRVMTDAIGYRIGTKEGYEDFVKKRNNNGL